MELKTLNKILTTIYKVVIIIGCIALAAQMGIIILNVFLRAFASGNAWLQINQPDMFYSKILGFIQSLIPTGISWMEEVAKDILMTAVTFIALAIGVKLDAHINVNVIPKKAPDIFTKILLKLKYIVVGFFGIIMLIFGTILVLNSRGYLASIPGFPIAFQYVMIPISGFLIIVHSILNLLGMEKHDEHIDEYFMEVGNKK